MKKFFDSFSSVLSVVMIMLALTAMPMLALADTASVATVSAPSAQTGLLSAIAQVLPVLFSFGGAYVTHAIHGHMQKIPASAQPLISSIAGILIAILTTIYTGNPMDGETTATLGGIAGLIGHGVMQTKPIEHASPPSTSPAV